MKISLKLANGATLEFEGDEKEFERVTAFLAEPPESLTAPGTEGADGGAGAASSRAAEERREDPALLEPAAVAQRLEQVGAGNDQEIMTVMAQMAIDAGRDGIDYPTLEHLYRELALRRPAQFPSKTLSNARRSGLLTMVTPGLWRTTYRGANFAHGHGRVNARPTGRRPQGSNGERGGESD